MLGDLSKSDWQNILGISDDQIPMAVILRGTRDLKGHYACMRSLFSDVIDIGDSNIVVDDVFIGKLDGLSVAYASVYGAPMASEVTHIFGVLGSRFVIQIGCCGALSTTLNPGDLFAATSAFCGEGASQYYKSDGKEVEASLDLVDALTIEVDGSAHAHRGRLYTTSALFAESREDIDRWRSQSFGAVDMETAATFAVAEHFGMGRAALLYVFDCPQDGQHILLDDHETGKLRRLGNERMIATVLRAIAHYAERTTHCTQRPTLTHFSE